MNNSKPTREDGKKQYEKDSDEIKRKFERKKEALSEQLEDEVHNTSERVCS